MMQEIVLSTGSSSSMMERQRQLGNPNNPSGSMRQALQNHTAGTSRCLVAFHELCSIACDQGELIICKAGARRPTNLRVAVTAIASSIRSSNIDGSPLKYVLRSQHRSKLRSQHRSKLRGKLVEHYSRLETRTHLA